MCETCNFFSLKFHPPPSPRKRKKIKCKSGFESSFQKVDINLNFSLDEKILKSAAHKCNNNNNDDDENGDDNSDKNNEEQTKIL